MEVLRRCDKLLVGVGAMPCMEPSRTASGIVSAGEIMSDRIPADIQSIINTLNQRHVEVTGPTARNGEAVYRVNDHTLTETEMRTLAHEDQLTTWAIFDYVRRRDHKAI